MARTLEVTRSSVQWRRFYDWAQKVRYSVHLKAYWHIVNQAYLALMFCTTTHESILFHWCSLMFQYNLLLSLTSHKVSDIGYYFDLSPVLMFLLICKILNHPFFIQGSSTSVFINISLLFPYVLNISTLTLKRIMLRNCIK